MRTTTARVAEQVLLAWSGGKDSCMALEALAADPSAPVAGLLTTVEAGTGRVAMHRVHGDLLRAQASSLGYSLDEVPLAPATDNSGYEAAMGAALGRWRQRGVSRVAHGDLFLADLRAYREALLAQVGMTAVFPLWGNDTAALAHAFIERGYRAVAVCVDTRVLDASFAGRELDDAFLRDLPEDVDPCGENGEFHTFVYDGPMFAGPVAWARGATAERDGFHYQDLLPG